MTDLFTSRYRSSLFVYTSIILLVIWKGSEYFEWLLHFWREQFVHGVCPFDIGSVGSEGKGETITAKVGDSAYRLSKFKVAYIMRTKSILSKPSANANIDFTGNIRRTSTVTVKPVKHLAIVCSLIAGAGEWDSRLTTNHSHVCKCCSHYGESKLNRRGQFAKTKIHCESKVLRI